MDKSLYTFLDKETKKTFETIFYHFHHVRFYENNIVDFGWRHPTMPVVEKMYTPYILQLREVEQLVKTIKPDFNIPLQKFTLIKTGGLRNKLKYVYKKYYRFNVFNTEKLISKYKD